jgi:hypothetical protein
MTALEKFRQRGNVKGLRSRWREGKWWRVGEMAYIELEESCNNASTTRSSDYTLGAGTTPTVFFVGWERLDVLGGGGGKDKIDE